MRSRTYDKEFKLNAVMLYKNSNKRVSEISKDLGIPPSTLTCWIKQYNKEQEKSFPGSGNIKASNESLHKLKKEIYDIRMERDILKKALAIFSKQK